VMMKDRRRRVAIGDFGESRLTTMASMTGGRGTRYWLAPECSPRPKEARNADKKKQKVQYSSAADMYSLGVTMWEIVTRLHPRIQVCSMKTVNLMSPFIQNDHEQLPDLSRACKSRCSVLHDQIKALYKGSDQRPTAAVLLTTLKKLDHSGAEIELFAKDVTGDIRDQHANENVHATNEQCHGEQLRMKWRRTAVYVGAQQDRMQIDDAEYFAMSNSYLIACYANATVKMFDTDTLKVVHEITVAILEEPTYL